MFNSLQQTENIYYLTHLTLVFRKIPLWHFDETWDFLWRVFKTNLDLDWLFLFLLSFSVNLPWRTSFLTQTYPDWRGTGLHLALPDSFNHLPLDSFEYLTPDSVSSKLTGDKCSALKCSFDSPLASLWITTMDSTVCYRRYNQLCGCHVMSHRFFYSLRVHVDAAYTAVPLGTHCRFKSPGCFEVSVSDLSV